MTREQRIGQAIVVAYLVVVLIGSISIIVFYQFAIGPQKLGVQLTRLVLEIALFVWLYSGSKAAKWICVVLFAAGGLFGLWGLVSGDVGLFGILGLTMLTALYLSFSGILVLSATVNGFLAFRRGEPPPFQV